MGIFVRSCIRGKMILFTVLACVSVCLAYDEVWEDYKLKYGKVYSGEQDVEKYLTWKENVEGIETHNAFYADTYQQGINQFTDMTDEEFKSGYLTLKIPEEYLNGSMSAPGRFVPSNRPLPNAVDWRDHGMVTPIKNQGQCGSCYSFAATGALEAQWRLHSGNLVSLSESQIVDCSGRYGNQGCGGGWYQAAWHYIKDAGGSACESKYPYVARKGWCKYGPHEQGCATVSSWHDTSPGSEADLTAALTEVGPVAVAIDASRNGFRSYRGGVYYDPYCSSRNLDHAVLAIGYGSEGGSDYYLVKNSWGTWWGADGYIKMARNKRNHCGIASQSSYPIV